MGEGFDFGEALEWMRAGKKVARIGWNGKGMWLAYQRGYPEGIPINQNTADATGLPVGTVVRSLARFADGCPRERLGHCRGLDPGTT